VFQLLVTANVPGSPILVALMKEAIQFSETLQSDSVASYC
jgi:hypothetical protein